MAEEGLGCQVSGVSIHTAFDEISSFISYRKEGRHGFVFLPFNLLITYSAVM
jgi:hypothetical protein